jgi:hypothetical protein
MRRRLINLFVWTLAGLAVLTAVVWVRSFWRVDRVYIRTAGAQWRVESSGGGLTMDRFGGWPEGPTWAYQSLDVDFFRQRTPLVSYSPRNVWRGGPLIGATGRAWVQLTATGAVDWGTQLSLEAFKARAAAPPDITWVPFSSVRISYWAVILLLLLPVIGRFVRWMSVRIARRSRRSRGLCVDCGYDLRASPARCPECGASVVTGPRVAAEA